VSAFVMAQKKIETRRVALMCRRCGCGASRIYLSAAREKEEEEGEKEKEEGIHQVIRATSAPGCWVLLSLEDASCFVLRLGAIKVKVRIAVDCGWGSVLGK
jgi:hypothetical protein